MQHEHSHYLGLLVNFTGPDLLVGKYDTMEAATRIRRFFWASRAFLHNPAEVEFPLTPDGVTPRATSPGCPGG
jgi:hypothetical protein